jgi:hypothetical protein
MKKILSLIMLLVAIVTGAHAGESTADYFKVDNSVLYAINTTTGTRNDVIQFATSASSFTVGSNQLKVLKNSTATVTVSVAGGKTITNIALEWKDKPNNMSTNVGTLSSDATEWTGSATAITFTNAESSDRQIKKITVTYTGDYLENISSTTLTITGRTGYSSSNIYALAYTTNNNAYGLGLKAYCNSSIQVSNNNPITLYSTKALKSVVIKNADGTAMTMTANSGSVDADNKWTASDNETTDVTFTNKSGGNFTPKTVEVEFAAAGPVDPVFTLSKSALEVGETAKILVGGKDIFATNFTAGTLWESYGDGPYISLSSDGVVTAVKNTPANYYFTFFGTTKDATKYNSASSGSMNLTIAKKYSVTYDLADATAGTVPTEEAQVEGAQFTVAVVPTDIVAPTGKEFKCWNDGTNDYDPGDTYTVGTSDITLTAVYQDKTYQGLTPSETLDFSNLGSTFSTMWFDNDGKMDNNFYFDAVNGKVVISAYAIYQSNASDRNLNLWATTDSGNSSTGTWTATGDFKGSTYYFNNDARAANIQASARVHYYRVTGITSVSALFNGKAAIEAYEVNSGVVSPDYAKQNKIAAAGTATITELDADKEYIILVRGDNGTSGIRFYEVEFTFPAITTETITIPSEGFATYVTSSALDFSSQNGAFKAYAVSGVSQDKSFVTTAEVTQVPAGTALLLKGAAGSYNVEIIASAEDVTNLLQASNGGVKGDNSTVFAYSKSQGKFMKVAQDVVIPAGKAYLKITTPNVGDALDIDFDGATAVEAIAEANEADAAAPVKVIKNGKLFIGNYNVAGQLVK